ncbi:MAG: thiolase family protein [Lachnospiraceae bacterium]|nr:thiolase family protein [Lachnospiraceae bacterium]
MERVCIAGGLRSYIGVENGIYRNLSAEQLGAFVLREILYKYQVPEEDIGFVIAGNGVGAGGNLTRLMMLEAGIREEIPAMTVDVQCGSGLEAVSAAAAKIECGLIETAIAGGFESCSTKPVRIRNPHHPDYMGNENYDIRELFEHGNAYRTAKFVPGKPDELAMFRGAEDVAALWKMDKHRLNRYVITSHERAAKAAKDRELQEMIAAPCFAYEEKGAGRKMFGKDEGIRPDISERLLNRLPMLIPGGEYITAGNSCLTHDGAAFVLLCSKEYLTTHGLSKKAEIVDVVSAGGSPWRSPESILPAIDQLLARNHLTVEEITAWEYNEAFAVIDYLMEEKYGKDCGRYNIFGGALAYGHPYGASGGIIILHLLEAMRKLELPDMAKRHGQGKYGIAAIAAAGGIGTAMLLKA